MSLSATLLAHLSDPPLGLESEFLFTANRFFQLRFDLVNMLGHQPGRLLFTATNTSAFLGFRKHKRIEIGGAERDRGHGCNLRPQPAPAASTERRHALAPPHFRKAARPSHAFGQRSY
mmetsp:Transcript_5372/g.12837  ORF Transcript_5372/g.12837 Transcript_5372/m.12837 type:complete len:118 (+) Transcript_5372:154-507(+)